MCLRLALIPAPPWTNPPLCNWKQSPENSLKMWHILAAKIILFIIPTFIKNIYIKAAYNIKYSIIYL